MNERLGLLQVVVLTAYAVGMTIGQVLFKLAANRSTLSPHSTEELLTQLLFNSYFVAAIVLYATFSVLWVWILSFSPLSRAYPFVALSFVLTPLAGTVLFNEAISHRFIVGLIFLLGGLFLIAG